MKRRKRKGLLSANHCQVLLFLPGVEQHHYTYKDYGRDRYRNTIRVSKLAHWLIHGVAGLTLIGGKGATKRQNALASSLGLALLRFPNPLQRVLHRWACLPGVVKLGLMAVGLFYLGGK